jgi:hypothetical protein
MNSVRHRCRQQISTNKNEKKEKENGYMQEPNRKLLDGDMASRRFTLQHLMQLGLLVLYGKFQVKQGLVRWINFRFCILRDV